VEGNKNFEDKLNPTEEASSGAVLYRFIDAMNPLRQYSTEKS